MWMMWSGKSVEGFRVHPHDDVAQGSIGREELAKRQTICPRQIFTVVESHQNTVTDTVERRGRASQSRVEGGSSVPCTTRVDWSE